MSQPSDRNTTLGCRQKAQLLHERVPAVTLGNARSNFSVPIGICRGGTRFPPQELYLETV